MVRRISIDEECIIYPASANFDDMINSRDRHNGDKSGDGDGETHFDPSRMNV